MQNVIWSNDTDRIDSIVDYWKEEAARAAEDMAKDPKGTIDDACWPVTDILDRAWRQAVSDYELPTVASVVDMNNVGEIIADGPWRHMEYETWSVDEHDDSLRDILRKTTPLGPRIRAVYGMPAPENTTKKR